MLKYTYLLFFFLSTTQICLCQAQKENLTEFGLTLNWLNYSGDLAEKRLVIAEGEVGFGLFIRHEMSSTFFVNSNLLFGRLSGDDKNNNNLKDRRYKFFSPLTEVSISGEYHPFGNKPIELGEQGSRFSPYVFGGLGISFTNPKAEFYGLGDSPFPEPDPQKVFPAIPVGVGARVEIFEKLSAQFSVGWRPVFSDKLDGVRINGNPDNNDWYTNIQLGIAYALRGREQ